MKYYEILFNSSQSSRSGGVGFGIRAQSENLPEEYLKAVPVDDKYQKGKFRALYASELFADTSKILTYPVQYSFRTFETAEGKRLYALRRCVPLEFDYAYYENGKATRPGNYAEHTLLFDEKPDASLFTLLYEQPEEGTLGFRPRNRVPDPQCAELKEMMLGKMADFPAADKSCRTLYAQPVQPCAYHILFHLAEARRQKKALVVKLAEQGKNVVMADVCRLMYDCAPDFTFACTYTQSVNPSIDLTYTTEYNTAALFPESPAYLCCEAAQEPQTDAWRKYGVLLRHAVETGDGDTARKLSRWLLTGDYIFVENASHAASVAFFNYRYMPANYTAEDLKNDELTQVIVRKGDLALLHDRIAELLAAAVEARDDEVFIEALMRVHRVRQCGAEVAPAVARVKEACCAYLLETPERVAKVFDRVPREVFEQYVVAGQFTAKHPYIVEAALRPRLLKLYRYFFADPARDISSILVLLFDKLEPRSLVEILRDANPDGRTREDCYVRTIRKNPTYVTPLWKVFKEDCGTAIQSDLMEEFREFAADAHFAPLFYDTFIRCSAAPLLSVARSAETMAVNEAYKALVVAGEAKDHTYRRLCEKVLPEVRRETSEKYVQSIERNILPLNTGGVCDVTKWVYLYNLLKDSWREDMKLNRNSVESYYDIAHSMTDKSYFVPVAYAALEAATQPPKVKQILRDLYDASNLDEETFLKMAAAYPPQKQTLCMGLYFRQQERSFKEALALVGSLDFYKGEDVLAEYYAKEYKTYSRNRKIKAFFRKLFSFGKKSEAAGAPVEEPEKKPRKGARKSSSPRK